MMYLTRTRQLAIVDTITVVLLFPRCVHPFVCFLSRTSLIHPKLDLDRRISFEVAVFPFHHYHVVHLYTISVNFCAHPPLARLLYLCENLLCLFSPREHVLVLYSDYLSLSTTTRHVEHVYTIYVHFNTNFRCCFHLANKARSASNAWRSPIVTLCWEFTVTCYREEVLQPIN
jgi:hypothetical protein